jgi:hypothetical protein
MAHQAAPRAELDLDDIWLYVAGESGSIESANRLSTTLLIVSSYWPAFHLWAVLAMKILASGLVASLSVTM